MCLTRFVAMLGPYFPGSGRLGMHQDKSESRDSIRRGREVIENKHSPDIESTKYRNRSVCQGEGKYS